MFKKENFFKGHNIKSIQYKKNNFKTKKIYKDLIKDINNFKIPFLESYKKNYQFDFSPFIIKKFSKYNKIIIIGMGGSILGTKSIYTFFKKKIKKKLFFFDNLDPNLNWEFNKIKNLKNSCFIVVSKSGNTLETITNINSIFSFISLKNKLVVITELKNSNLINFAKKYKAEIIEHKNFIGGRYSVLSEVGMFPAALMNLNISKFKNLNKLIKNSNFKNYLINNVSAIFTLNQIGVKNSIILNYDYRLKDLSFWHQQLVGESLGKKGRGIMPIVSTCPKDHHSLLQLYLDGPRDKFFTFFSTQKNKKTKGEIIINSQCEALKKVFKIKKIPYRHFIFKKYDEKELGSAFTYFVLETLLLAKLMKVNPYDQPAVEQVKIETEKLIK